MGREPLAVRGAVVAAIVAVLQAAMAFGLPLTAEQFAVVSTAVNLVATAVVVVLSRGTVTPVDDPRGSDGQPLVSGDDY